MTSLTPQEMQQQVGMRPTLLIGLGGTGQKVLVQLKGRFIRNYGQVPPAVEFLCFDTDQTAEQMQVEGEIVRLTGETELVNIGGVQTANILSNLDKYPAIADWITEDKERIPKGAITMGAKQVRPLGRLSLYWNVEKIYNKIFASIQRQTDLKLGFEKRGINVFIICSVCGGTGSGIILDIAYLTRNAIEKAGVDPEFCYLNGILALPSVFPSVDKNGIESNAFACLRELDYFMEGEWLVDYGNPRVPPFANSGRRPFNIVYLVDARNEQGQGLPGLDEVAPMVAEAIYLQVSSQVGNANNSAFDNVSVLASRTLNHDENREVPTAYSSLGTASLVFPVSKIIELCASRLGQELLLHEILNKEVPASRVEASVNTFMQANQIDIDPLLQQVSRDIKNNVMRIALDPRQLDRFKENEVFGATSAYLSKAENLVDNEFNQLLETNRKTLNESLSKILEDNVYHELDDPSGSLYLVLAFLQKLDTELVTIRGILDKDRVENDQKRERSQATLQQTQNAFGQSFRTGAIGRSIRIKETRNRYIEMHQSYLVARFEARKREVAIALLASLSTKIQNLRTLVQRTIDRLQFAQGQFDHYVEKNSSGKSRTDFILAQDITTDSDIEQYYKKYFDTLGDKPASGLLDTKGPLHTWLNLEQDALVENVLSYARSVFEPLRQDITIESIILQKKEQLDPRKRLNDLVNRSVPFWMYRTAGVLGQDWAGEEKIVVIGVPDKNKSIYKDVVEKGQQLTSTFAPHEITVLQTKHGVPLFALTQYKDFKASHDFVLSKRIKPLYVFPEVRPGGEKAKQIFALGIAFGFIFKSGVYYHIIPSNPRDLPIQLDQGMADSLSTFRYNANLITHVSNQIEDQIARVGADSAKQTLEGFVRGAYVFELKGGAAKTNIDLSTMSQDSIIGKPGSVNFDLVKEMQDSLEEYIKKILRG